MHVFIHQPGIVPVILLHFTNHHHDTELSGFGNGAVLIATANYSLHVRTIIRNDLLYISLIEKNSLYIFIYKIYLCLYLLHYLQNVALGQ